jgi:methylated-DNA-protein-cysteine methyltransferase related protein
MKRARQSASSARSSQIDRRPGPDPLTPEERIWQVVASIPRGRVATYGQIAHLAGMPSHARLVGRVLGNLPRGSRLPWHRVVNAGLKVSPRGDDRAMLEQRRRLEREGVTFVGARIARTHLWLDRTAPAA